MQTLINASSDGLIFMMADTVYEGTLSISNKDGTSGDKYIIRTWHKYSASGHATFSGFKELGTFSDEAGNIWRITDTDLSSDYRFTTWPPGFMAGILMRNMLLINDVPYPVSRFPNTGYRVAESWSTADPATYVYDNQALDNNYDDAVISFTDEEWGIVRAKIDVSGNNLNFQSGTTSYDMGSINDQNSGGDGVKYFLSNHEYFCDANGDHAYDPDNNTLSVYYSGNLNSQTVKYPEGDNGIYIYSSDYWLFEDIAFEGYNRCHIYSSYSNFLTVDSCNFNYMPGYSGIHAIHSDDIIVRQNSLSDGISYGIFLWHCSDPLITENYVNNVGATDQMMADQIDGSTIGIYARECAEDVIITHNYVDSSGFDGIATNTFVGSGTTSILIEGNIVTNVGFVLNDGGAIYNFETQNVGDFPRIIRNNYVDGSYGNAGFSPYSRTWHWGIYLDGGSEHWLVDSNVVIRANAGLNLNGTDQNELANNILFSNNTHISGQPWAGAGIKMQQYGHYGATTDVNVHDNIIIMRDSTAEHGVIWFQGYAASLDNNGTTSNNNKFYNPFLETEHVAGTTVWGDPVTSRTRSSMYSVLGFELNSTWNSPDWTFQDVSGIYRDEFVWIFYNWSETDHVFSLGSATFKDIPSGTNVDTSITVDPYKSKVLFYVSGSLAGVDNPVYPAVYNPGGQPPYPPSGHIGLDTPHEILLASIQRNILIDTKGYNVGGGASEEEPPPLGDNNLLDGLLAYYSFTTNATDDHSTHDGTVNGATQGDPGGGWSGGGAYSFDGGDNINIGDISFSGDSGSISLWCNPDATGYTSRSMIGRWYGYDGLKVLGGNFSAGQDNIFSTDDADYTTGWHHVVLVYNGTDLRLYVDGVLESTESQTGTWGRNGDDWQIGNDGNSTGPWIGYIDEVAISNNSWTPTQVTTLYNSGTVFPYGSFD
jgi:hypothetical protein